MVHERLVLSSYLNTLLSAGRTVFAADEAQRALGVNRGPFLDAAERLQRRKVLLSPRRGFYVVVPPQFASWGAPPPSWYIDALMHNEAQPYYVGLLKAAELHGAAHQAVMEFQVVTAKRLPKIRAGRNLIVFYYRKDIASIAAEIEDRKTDTGKMKISSAALTAIDLLRYPQASGGIDNVATVLTELAEKIDPERLAVLAEKAERPVVQRLGHLLDRLGHGAKAQPMFDALATRGPALDGARSTTDPESRLHGATTGARSPLACRGAAVARARRMIPQQNIVAWGAVAPWADQRQVEQDLIISRALIEIFSNDVLREALRFRGGTALNKLHFPTPLRYSEDIDLVRTSGGPIGAVLDALRGALEPWLGRAQFAQSQVAPKLRFRVDAEGGGGVPIRLKVEVNTREIQAFDAPAGLKFKVDSPWFSGEAEIPTFSREEMLATKLRALLQRDKGRDLYDLAHALDTFDGLDAGRVAEIFGQYLQGAGQAISRAQAQERMLAKYANPRFLLDMRPLLPAARIEDLTDKATADAFRRVFTTFVDRLPGDPWARTSEVKEKLGIRW